MMTTSEEEAKEFTSRLKKVLEVLLKEERDDAALDEALQRGRDILEQLRLRRFTVKLLKGKGTLKTPVHKLCKLKLDDPAAIELRQSAESLYRQWRRLAKKPPAACITPELIPNSAFETTLRLKLTVPPSTTKVTNLTVVYAEIAKSGAQKPESKSKELKDLLTPELMKTVIWTQGEQIEVELTGLNAGTWYDIRAKATGEEEYCWKSVGQASKFPLNATTVKQANDGDLERWVKLLNSFVKQARLVFLSYS